MYAAQKQVGHTCDSTFTSCYTQEEAGAVGTCHGSGHFKMEERQQAPAAVSKNRIGAMRLDKKNKPVNKQSPWGEGTGARLTPTSLICRRSGKSSSCQPRPRIRAAPPRLRARHPQQRDEEIVQVLQQDCSKAVLFFRSAISSDPLYGLLSFKHVANFTSQTLVIR